MDAGFPADVVGWYDAPWDLMDLRERLQETLEPSFEILRELTGGGMSRVFVARERALGRQVVLKVLSPDLAAGVNADRFQREMRVMAQLQHPCIVPLLTVGSTDGSPYYTMPFISGESVCQRLESTGRLPIDDAVRVLRDVASALAYAHEQGVVHRDIKPANVLLSGGYAVVTDFGIAKALASARVDTGQTGTLTAIGLAVGTAAYMAPEQMLGDPTADHRVDIYALGVMAYELLTGAPPFAGRTLQATFGAHVSEAPKPIEQLRPELPSRLAKLVMRCLAKAPDERPQTAVEVQRQLEMILALLSTGARPSAPSSPRASRPSARRVAASRVARAALLIAVIVAAAMAVARGFRAITERRQSPILANVGSVAVLPLIVAPSDSQLVQTSAAVADELAAVLRRVRTIRVSSRASAFAFRDSAIVPSTVASRLNTDALVLGRMRRDDEAIAADVQVVSRDGRVAWQHTFRATPTTLVAMQTALADSVLRVIGQSASAAQRGPGTLDPVAYDAYIRARYLQSRRGASSLRRAIALFQEAVRRDTTFAEAYAGLAESLAILPLYENIRADSVYVDAMAAANAAIRQDENIAEAYTAIGNVRANQMDWEGATAAHSNALKKDPNSASAMQYLAELAVLEGRLPEARQYGQRAVSLDPMSPLMAAVLATIYLYEGNLDSAYGHAKRAYDLDPTFAGSQRAYGRVLLEMDSTAKALQLLSAAPQGTTGLAVLVHAYARAGRTAEARRVLDQLLREDALHPVAAVPIAFAYAGLGDTNAALGWIEKLPGRRELLRQSASVSDPGMRSLWGTKRFATVMKQLGLDASRYTTGLRAPRRP